MKAISLWQPWASAIALGSKRVETRHWYTAHRGQLAIHAAKRVNMTELSLLSECPNWAAALHPIAAQLGADFTNPKRLREALPLGAIVAVCNLSECVTATEEFVGSLDEIRMPPGQSGPGWTERHMGNFGPGRYAWILSDIRPLATPIPWKGGQGFFDVPNSVITSPLAQLAGAL